MRFITILALPWLLAAAAPCSLGPDRDRGQILPGRTSIRAVAIGDFGDPGNKAIQQEIAAHIAANGKFDFGITVGDNFYPSGVRDANDPKWTSIWAEDYGKLGAPFFAALGNHDYRGNEAAQIGYGKANWNMPCKYYSFAAGPVRFYALDTDEGHTGVLSWLIPRRLGHEQLDWLTTQLGRHTEKWKVVYGHHPAYTVGMHRGQRRVKEMRERVVPLMKGVNAYIAGHDHDLQYRMVNGMHHPLVGGDGRLNDGRRDKARPEAGAFYQPFYGYLVLNADESGLKFEIVGGEKPGSFKTLLTAPEAQK